MRKILFVLSLASLTLLAGASDAFAQRRGGGGGRSTGGGRSYSGGRSYNGGREGYNRGYDRGYGYGGAFGLGYGLGYGSDFGYYGGLGYGLPLGGYGYSPSYYNTTPSYYSEPSMVLPTTQIRDSYYPATQAPQTFANLKVLVPSADTKVWFENQPTKQTGMDRVFESPSLDANHNYTYTIKAQWMANGKKVDRERVVNVQAGQNLTVNFRETAGETVPSPMPPMPGTSSKN